MRKIAKLNFWFNLGNHEDRSQLGGRTFAAKAKEQRIGRISRRVVAACHGDSPKNSPESISSKNFTQAEV